LTFLVLAYPGYPGKKAIKREYVCLGLINKVSPPTINYCKIKVSQRKQNNKEIGGFY